MAKGLRRSEVLQDPGDLAARIRDTLRPCTRRRLAIEKLNGALRSTDYVALLPPQLCFRGLSQTKAASERGEEACHVFKFVRRESLDPKIEIHNPFSGVEESPRDVVLLIKAFMGSLELAQVPEVCFPFVGLKYVGDPRALQICTPGNLSQRQSREFLRTAD